MASPTAEKRIGWGPIGSVCGRYIYLHFVYIAVKCICIYRYNILVPFSLHLWVACLEFSWNQRITAQNIPFFSSDI